MFPLFGGQSQYEPLHFQTVERMLMAPVIPGNCVWGFPEPTIVWGRWDGKIQCQEPKNWVQVMARPLPVWPCAASPSLSVLQSEIG